MKIYHVLFLALLFMTSCMEDFDCGDSSTTPVPEGPGPATQFYPARYSEGQSLKPTFYWNSNLTAEQRSAVEFRVEINTSDGGEEWVLSWTPDTFIVFPEELAPFTEYQWDVVTRFSSGDRERSTHTHSFTTGDDLNNPPAPAQKLYPPNHTGELFPVDVVLDWHSFDPDGDEVRYDLWYYFNGRHLGIPDDTTFVFATAESEYALSLEADAIYIWQVFAYDTHGDTAWTRLVDDMQFSFYTEATPPPSYLYPDSGASHVPVNVTLSWECISPDGDPLTFHVSTGPSGGTLSRVAEDLTSPHFELAGLEYSSAYDWKVTAEDEYGQQFHGPVWSFTTENDPGTWQGIYAELFIHRTRYLSESETPGYYDIMRIDHVSARFDSVYAPDGYIYPKQPAHVDFSTADAPSGYALGWEDTWKWYYYNNPIYPPFLVPGLEYKFTIIEGDDVSALVTDPILYPNCSMDIYDPVPFSWVPKGGFTIMWNNYDVGDCPAMVRLRIEDLSMGEWTDFDREIPNTGSYAFTAGDLSLLDPMVYQISVVLSVDNTEQIIAAGYDPRSYIIAETWSTVWLYLQE